MNSICNFFLKTLKTSIKFSFLTYIFCTNTNIFMKFLNHQPNKAYKKAILNPNK